MSNEGDLVYRGKRIGEMTRGELVVACRELVKRYMPAMTRLVSSEISLELARYDAGEASIRDLSDDALVAGAERIARGTPR